MKDLVLFLNSCWLLMIAIFQFKRTCFYEACSMKHVLCLILQQRTPATCEILVGYSEQLGRAFLKTNVEFKHLCYILYPKINITNVTAHSNFYIHPSACLNPVNKKTYLQKWGDYSVSLPVQQILSAEAANKADTHASSHDVDTCLLRTGPRISANFMQVTKQQTDGNDFKHYKPGPNSDQATTGI